MEEEPTAEQSAFFEEREKIFWRDPHDHQLKTHKLLVIEAGQLVSTVTAVTFQHRGGE